MAGFRAARLKQLDGLPSSTARALAHFSDEAIVALVARAEDRALAELYDRYGAPAHALAFRVLRDSSLAEDAVQDAFLAVWRDANRFMPERANAASWIMMLVHRRAVDLVRKQQLRRTDPLPDDHELDGPHSSAEDSAWRRLERERVQAALRLLPDQQRETLELAYYAGFTQSELAERLGRPLGTIKSQTHNALANLRELLEPAAEETSWKTT